MSEIILYKSKKAEGVLRFRLFCSPSFLMILNRTELGTVFYAIINHYPLFKPIATAPTIFFWYDDYKGH